MTVLHGQVIENPAAYERAIRRNIIENARKTWRSTTERHGEIEDSLEAGRVRNDFGDVLSYTDNFMGSMASAFDRFGKLTTKQTEAIIKGIEAKAAKKAEWALQQATLNANRAFIGSVGEKITVHLKVVHIVCLDSIYGTNYIHICEDDNRNVIIYRGKSCDFPVVGESATVKAVVKEHGLRDGVKQTIIQRPKVVDTTI